MNIDRLRSAWAAAFLMAALCGCGHISLLSLPKPPSAAPAPAAAPSNPVCPGSMLADLEPEPQLPAGAGFPGAQTEAESVAVSLYLTWLHAYAVWARHGWARATEGKDYCSTPR
jgi:hypothetical protein